MYVLKQWFGLCSVLTGVFPPGAIKSAFKEESPSTSMHTLPSAKSEILTALTREAER